MRLLLLLLALLTAGLLARRSGSSLRPFPVAPPATVPAGDQGGPDSLEVTAATTGERELTSASACFEPLEPPPHQLVVQLLLGETEEPAIGAEVYLFEHEDYCWYAERAPDGSQVTDVEADVRARGRRLECDAQGRVHLALPARLAFLTARKGASFGAESFDASDAPEDTLRLFPAHECRVRVTSEAGEPMAGIPVVIGKAREARWRASTDPAGEVRVPNIEWLLADFLSDGESWFVGVEEASSRPVLRSFAWREPIPHAIELRLPAASALHLRLRASDGTAVPVRGMVELVVTRGAGRATAVRFGDARWAEVPLLRGEARIPRAEPGAWIAAGVDLDGDYWFEQSLRVPEHAEGGDEVALTLPEHSQVLLLRALDAQGAPLAGRRLLWISHAEDTNGATLLDHRAQPFVTDESGHGALVLDRSDLVPPELEEGEEPPFPRRLFGRVQGLGADAAFASRMIEYAGLGSGSVRQLGDVRVEGTEPLVRGRLVDVHGVPLAFGRVELLHLQLVEGEEQHEDFVGPLASLTGPDGRFEIHGHCPGGRLRLVVERDGYDLPAGASLPEFECGTNPELEVALERNGSLCASVLADAPLDRWYTWILTGPGGEKRACIRDGAGPGELEHEFRELVPGRYRIALATGDPLDAPLVECDDVFVQEGTRTRDPRLSGVPLHVAPDADGVPRSPARANIQLEVADANGRVLDQGLYVTWGYCSWGRSEFRGGRIELQGDYAGRSLGLWAPGQRYWEGKCPERDQRIVLEPALHASVHVEMPQELRRLGARLLVDVLDRENDASEQWLPELTNSAEFDPHGLARFEFPAPGRMRLGLRAAQLDAAGRALGACVPLETEEGLWIDVADVPGERRFELAISAAAWSGLAEALRGTR